jgi:hypothetical protein
MTFSKDSPPNTSTPSLAEQLRMQRQELEQESRSSAASDNAAPEESGSSDNAAEESATLSSPSRLRSFTAASELLRTQRQLQQESRSSAPDNIERRGSLSSIGPRSSTAAPRGSPHRASRSMDSLRSIIDRARAIIDEDDDEVEDSVTSIRSDDSNSQP